MPTAPISKTTFAGTTRKMQESSRDDDEERVTDYRFIDMAISSNVFSLVACHECGHTLILRETNK